VNGGRIFYTQLGGVSDFENASFLRMLSNALYWAAEREIPQPPKPKVEKLQRKQTSMNLPLRTRVQPYKCVDQWYEQTISDTWQSNQTAVIVCDMWDRHWCQGAQKRCETLAKQMNPVLKACREAGILIVHAPSDTLGFYTNTEPRLRALQAPEAETPEPVALEAPDLPIDDSDGGCDTDETTIYWAWTRQSPHIEIADTDVIADRGSKIYNVFNQYGIKNVIIMGVHTNMCILNRSFGIKQMTKWGFPCVLVRDLTDAMYDPDDPPQVSHEKGTQLVIEHIEKYWCPTVTRHELMETIQ
jgi:nicotinamidase-related amidase